MSSTSSDDDDKNVPFYERYWWVWLVAVLVVVVVVVSIFAIRRSYRRRTVRLTSVTPDMLPKPIPNANYSLFSLPDGIRNVTPGLSAGVPTTTTASPQVPAAATAGTTRYTTPSRNTIAATLGAGAPAGIFSNLPSSTTSSGGDLLSQFSKALPSARKAQVANIFN